MTIETDDNGTDSLILAARSLADYFDWEAGGGQMTEDGFLLRRLAQELEARRDRHMWRARAIRLQGERDFISVHAGRLEERLSRIRNMLQSVSYYSQKPHKAAFDVIEVILFLDGDERE